MSTLNIFLTVGSQMPFDRLTAAVAHWAQSQHAHGVVAQVGHTLLSEQELQGLQWQALMPHATYAAQCRQCDLIVAHAGMGSVLTALELGKPLLVMPRRGALRETRNDHQVATARHLLKVPGITVAWEPHEVGRALDTLVESVQSVGTVASVGAVGSVGTEPSAHRMALIEHLRLVIRS